MRAQGLLRLLFPRLTVSLTVTAMALLLFGVSGCAKGGNSNAGPKPAPVAAAAVEGRDLPLMIEAVGTLQGWEEVTVSSEVSGTIDRVFVDLGDHVKPGQPLVAISPKELRAAHERAEGALARAQAQAEEAARRRARGVERMQAILEANHTRLRPILMTTFAVVAGMLPIAFGRGDGAASRASTAMVIVGGQMLALILTLLITPVVYSLLDDLRGVRATEIPRLLVGRLRMGWAGGLSWWNGARNARKGAGR